MTFRISFIVPLLLAVSTIASSLLIYLDSKRVAENNIRSDVLSQVKMDITRLQNILYNRLTEKDNSYQDARLNLSVTAMVPIIRTLILADENDKILLANRYTLEGSIASRSVNGFDRAIAQKTKLQNIPVVRFLKKNDTILHGYYPVILQLESSYGKPTKRVGVLFTEVNIGSKLSAAYREAAIRSLEFAGVMLFVSVLVAFLLHHLISRRLQILNMASREFAAGKLDTQVNLKGKDELALLGNTFDEMALRIKEDIHRREVDELELRKLNDSLEDRVAERTALLNEAQSIGHIGNWNWDVSSGDLSWSDEIFRIFGYQPGEIQPTYERFMSMIHPDDVARIKKSEQEAFSKGKRHSIDHRIILLNGEERWVHEEAIACLNSQGETVSLSGTVQDITDRKIIENNLIDAKNEAERSNEAKSVFLSHMSHELRTPLNAILGFAQILELDSKSDQQSGFINEITVAGNHLLGLITELLDLGRIEAGRIMIVMESIHLDDVIHEAVKMTRSMMEQNDLSFNLLCESGYQVIADNIRLRQVLVNLLSNAAKYNRKGGSISLSCKQDKDVIKIIITDTGIGIAEQNLPKLFTPFERAGAEFSGVDGTGIGLALSKQLVELMNGRIGVESRQEEGSTFWVELPVAKQMKIHPNKPGNVMLKISDNLHILYIEDNVANVRVVETLLGQFNQLKVISACNGNYGIELARELLPDIILLDIKLPDINGYQVLSMLRNMKITKNIPVIALSADALPLDIERGLEAGFDGYLTKPVELNRLIEVLNKFAGVKKSSFSLPGKKE